MAVRGLRYPGRLTKFTSPYVSRVWHWFFKPWSQAVRRMASNISRRNADCHGLCLAWLPVLSPTAVWWDPQLAGSEQDRTWK